MADAISDKKSDRSDVETRGSDEPILIDTSSTQRDKHKAIGDKIFNALHKLVYEWYGIRLDWLYSFDEFKADNKDKFLSEQNNTLTEIIKKISNDKGQTTLRFLSKDDILSAIKIDNEIIIEIYKKEENSNWTVKLPAGFSEELKPAVKQLISALPPENSGDTISLHNITSLLDLIQMKFEKSKYLKDQFEKWVNELWNSQKTYLSSKSSLGLHNDQELLKAAKPVQGFYSDDDVMLLIQALLKLSGFERNNDPKTFGKINDKAVYILNSTSLSDGQGRLDDLARDICKILLMDMGTEKNILIPIRLQHEYHWVTAQLKIGINNRITAYIHDSLYDNKCVHDDIIFQLSDLFIKKEQMNQILGAKSISITFEDEEVQKLNLILNKFDVKKSIVEKIQKETSNVYCGGYTARIIANLVKTDLTEENKKEIWNCNSNKDILLRKNDACIVNNSNIPNLYLFGTHEQSSDTLHTLSTNAENNRKNQTKHILERIKEDLNSSDQKGEILSKLKEITSTFLFEKEGVLDTKNDLLEATNIYNTLRTLQKNLVENNPLATYLFKHNEESNLELDESGGCNN